MSSVYNPDDTNNPSSFTEPDDGDNEDAASVNVFLEGLADKAAYTQKNYPLDTTYSVFRAQPYNLTPITSDLEAAITQHWGLDAGGVWVQYNVTLTTANGIDHELELPDACFLQNVYVNLNGKLITGHANLPGQPPQIRVFKTNVTSGVSTAISSLTTDGSADVAHYDVAHQIQAVVNATVDRTNFRYRVRIIGESGANSVAGLNILGVTAQFQVSSLDKGAS